MIPRERVEEILEDFGKALVRESRKNLTRKKINASRDLYDSLKYKLNVSKNSLDFDFLMNKYGEFVDKGVSGTEVKYNTPFSFKAGIQNRPSPRHFEKWIKQKGIRGRDAQGRFITNKSFAFMIASAKQKKGLKPSYFFSRPFELAFARLPEDVVEAYGLDIEDFMEFTLNR